MHERRFPLGGWRLFVLPKVAGNVERLLFGEAGDLVLVNGALDLVENAEVGALLILRAHRSLRSIKLGLGDATTEA